MNAYLVVKADGARESEVAGGTVLDVVLTGRTFTTKRAGVVVLGPLPVECDARPQRVADQPEREEAAAPEWVLHAACPECKEPAGRWCRPRFASYPRPGFAHFARWSAAQEPLSPSVSAAARFVVNRWRGMADNAKVIREQHPGFGRMLDDLRDAVEAEGQR